MTGDPNPRFTLSWNRRGIDRLRTLGERAKQAGVLAEWVTTLRRVIDRLETDPRGCGDPLYPLRSLKLMMYRVIVDRVEVVYGVHETRPVVFIQDIRPRFGHPLEEQ
jgi:hypothetical protein